MRSVQIRIILGVFIVALAFTSVARGQEWIQRGPFGKPIAVWDDLTQKWSIPILVYSDDEQETYVPDITAPEWIYWFGADFRRTGKYGVFLYSYFKNDHWCLRNFGVAPGATKSDFAKDCAVIHYRRTWVKVDTRNKTVTIGQDMLLTGTSVLAPSKTLPSGKVESYAEIKGTPLNKKT